MSRNLIDAEACSTQGPLPESTGITCPRCGAGYGKPYPVGDSSIPAKQAYCPVCRYTWAEKKGR